MYVYPTPLAIIIHNKAINCPRNDLIYFFFVCDMNYKSFQNDESEVIGEGEAKNGGKREIM